MYKEALRQVYLPVLRFSPVSIIPSMLYAVTSWLGSVVGIATGYGLDDTGIESLWGEIFRTSPDRPWGPPSLLYNGCRVFAGGKERAGRDADPSFPSSSVVKKE